MNNYGQNVSVLFSVKFCTEGMHQLWVRDLIYNRDESEFYLIFEVMDQYCNDLVLKGFRNKQTSQIINLLEVMEYNPKNNWNFNYNKIVNLIVYANVNHNSDGYPFIECFLTGDEFFNNLDD